MASSNPTLSTSVYTLVGTGALSLVIEGGPAWVAAAASLPANDDDAKLFDPKADILTVDHAYADKVYVKLGNSTTSVWVVA